MFIGGDGEMVVRPGPGMFRCHSYENSEEKRGNTSAARFLSHMVSFVQLWWKTSS